MTFANASTLTRSTYRHFIRHFASASLLALGPIVVAVGLSVLMRDLKGWSGYGVSLGYAFVVVVFVAAVLRRFDGSQTSLWRALKIGRAELRLTAFSLVLVMTLTLIAIIYTTIFAMYSLTSWYVYIPAYMVLFGIALRFVVVAPLIVIDDKTAMKAADFSWYLTTKHKVEIGVAAALVGLPIGYGLPYVFKLVDDGSALMVLLGVVVNFMGWLMASAFGYCAYEHLSVEKDLQKDVGEAVKSR
ncbi:MAG: glycerophosphoryl diester phosphodiesterase membrane domain-containing protein [Magnetovibrio sp.]|nr:glycerophosphoryl diester phosphodiesterase membrane domain-containing protein [Magnetovibrio sp.]